MTEVVLVPCAELSLYTKLRRGFSQLQRSAGFFSKLPSCSRERSAYSNCPTFGPGSQPWVHSSKAPYTGCSNAPLWRNKASFIVSLTLKLEESTKSCCLHTAKKCNQSWKGPALKRFPCWVGPERLSLANPVSDLGTLWLL
jgi:hypothetical protein